MENGEPIISRVLRSSAAATASFLVIAIPNGYQSEMQVNQAFAWLHQYFHADLRMSFKAWTFEKLVSALDIRAMSVRIGKEADLIIIATSCAESLPNHIKYSLDSMTRPQRDDRAFVLALKENSHSSSAHTNTRPAATIKKRRHKTRSTPVTAHGMGLQKTLDATIIADRKFPLRAAWKNVEAPDANFFNLRQQTDS